jgi:transcription elongation factor Elf1
MPHVGTVTHGRTFFCPRCGALYSVTHSRPAVGDNDIAKCVVCLQIMARRGETTEVPVFKLIHRPEDA